MDEVFGVAAPGERDELFLVVELDALAGVDGVVDVLADLRFAFGYGEFPDGGGGFAVFACVGAEVELSFPSLEEHAFLAELDDGAVACAFAVGVIGVAVKSAYGEE